MPPPLFFEPDPPTEIKNIIDKTAGYVAKLGGQFEKTLMENEKGKPKFSFLVPNGPFNSYYLKKVKELRASMGKEETPAAPAPAVEAPKKKGKLIAQETKSIVVSIPQRLFYARRKLKHEHDFKIPSEYFTQDVPPGLTALDVDIIKMTAQFVARNGHSFQVGLTNREHKNPQFDFLKTTNPYYPFYASLVENYTRCLLPGKNFIGKLEEKYQNKNQIFDRLCLQHEKEKRDEQKKIAEEQQIEEDNESAAAINWHDFVVVETIDFFDEEEIPLIPMGVTPVAPPAYAPAPPPVAPAEDDMEMEVEDHHAPSVAPITHAHPAEIKVRKDYVKNATLVQQYQQAKNVKLTVCPRCGQSFPVDQMDEHMKMELMDQNTRTKIQQDQRTAIPMASNEDIAKNLMGLVKNRQDIYDEDMKVDPNAQPKRMEPPKPMQPVSVAYPPPPPPPSYVPMPMPVPTPLPMTMPPLPPPKVQLPMKQVLSRAPVPTITPIVASQMQASTQAVVPEDESNAPPGPNMLHEKDFLAQHGENTPVTLKISVPSDIKSSDIQVTVTLKDSVATIKEKIKEQIDMAANKQKLIAPGLGFLKDQFTAAYYNFTNGTSLTLSLKERGGKKK